MGKDKVTALVEELADLPRGFGATLTSLFDFTSFLYQIENGADCSGREGMGWVETK